MNFCIPTNIFVEKDCVTRHFSEFARYGKKALIVTGAHSAKSNGSLNDLISVLEKNNIRYQIFDQVEEILVLKQLQKPPLWAKILMLIL